MLEVLAAFESIHSPVVTFHEDSVGEAMWAKCKAEGWIAPLRAERWEEVHATFRPQD